MKTYKLASARTAEQKQAMHAAFVDGLAVRLRFPDYVDTFTRRYTKTSGCNAVQGIVSVEIKKVGTSAIYEKDAWKMEKEDET